MQGGPLRSPARLALLALAGLAGGCSPRAQLPLRVEYAGCKQVFFPGPACALDDTHRKLRLWVDLPREVPIDIEVGGRTIGPEATAAHSSQAAHRSPGSETAMAGMAEPDGQGIELEVPQGAAAVSLRASTPRGEAGWSLAIVPPRADQGSELHAAAAKANRQGRTEEARELFARAAAAHQAAGNLQGEVADRTVVAYLDIQGDRLTAARQAIDGLRLPAGAPAEAVFYRRYYAGMLEQRVGDARSALDDLTAAAKLARRCALTRLGLAAAQLLGRQLQALGRSNESAALFDGLRKRLPPDARPCDLAELLINQGWSLLLAGEAGQPLGDPIPLFEQASEIEERKGSDCLMSRERIVGNQLNLALGQLQAGRVSAVPALLSRAAGMDADATPFDRLWRLDLQARLALAEGRPAAARSLYQRLDTAAASALAPDSRWRAAYGEALCDHALGRPADALAALDRADRLLEDESLKVPIHEGREQFLAGREQATALHLELLLDGGRNADALAVARRSRSRLLRQLARGDRLAHLTPAEKERWYADLGEYWRQRKPLDDDTAADWTLPEDQRRRAVARRTEQDAVARRSLDHAFGVLGSAGERDAAQPPARPGEVTLAYHPIARGWVGFAQAEGSVQVHRFDLPTAILGDPQELANRLLAPFRAAITRARRVRILAYGELRGIAFHALPFGGDVLLAGRPVVYGLDLTAARGAPPAAARRALVVADPLRDLPEAAREGEAVAGALRARQARWTLELLEGTSATAEGVKRSLARSDLFHFAGHGIFAGARGWDSDLMLAGGTRLTVGDLLALPKVPRWVVLAGCDTGRSSAAAPIEGLGLASAFLLAGSGAVVATTGVVDDRAVSKMVADLYRRWDGSAPDLASLLQQAQLAWRRGDPAGGWATFRIFEP